MSRDFYLDKNKFDYYLTALGKEYKKLSKNPVQIVLVGGGAIFIRYSFRIMSLDLDGLLFPYKSDALKHAIHIVSDKYNIPVGWLNDDFIKTNSYSKNIFIYSEYYKTYSNLIEVRLIDPIHLLAMKLKSFRSYKRDQSDIIGILIEEKGKNNIITKDDIIKAYNELYDDTPIDDSLLFLDYLYSRNDEWESIIKNVQYEENINKIVISSTTRDKQESLSKQSIIDALLKRENNK